MVSYFQMKLVLAVGFVLGGVLERFVVPPRPCDCGAEPSVILV
jgi:hypothetical protein